MSETTRLVDLVRPGVHAMHDAGLSEEEAVRRRINDVYVGKRPSDEIAAVTRQAYREICADVR